MNKTTPSKQLFQKHIIRVVIVASTTNKSHSLTEHTLQLAEAKCLETMVEVLGLATHSIELWSCGSAWMNHITIRLWNRIQRRFAGLVIQLPCPWDSIRRCFKPRTSSTPSVSSAPKPTTPHDSKESSRNIKRVGGGGASWLNRVHWEMSLSLSARTQRWNTLAEIELAKQNGATIVVNNNMTSSYGSIARNCDVLIVLSVDDDVNVTDIGGVAGYLWNHVPKSTKRIPLQIHTNVDTTQTIHNRKRKLQSIGVIDVSRSTSTVSPESSPAKNIKHSIIIDLTQ